MGIGIACATRPKVQTRCECEQICVLAKFVFLSNFDIVFCEQQHAVHCISCVEDFVSRSFLRFLYVYIHKHAFIGMGVGIELVECASDKFIQRDIARGTARVAKEEKMCLVGSIEV